VKLEIRDVTKADVVSRTRCSISLVSNRCEYSIALSDIVGRHIVWNT